MNVAVGSEPGPTCAVARSSGSPHWLWPAVVLVFLASAAAMLEAFRAAPSDYIALVHKDTTEHGFRFFGRDYGRRIYGWIRRNYRPVTLVGARPLRDERFGILLLRRRLPT